VSTHAEQRTERLLHALLTTATDRGYDVAWTGGHGHALTFIVEGHAHELTVREEYEDQDVVPKPDDTAGSETDSGQRVQAQTRSVPTGRLRIGLTTGYEYSGRPRTWADRMRWSLEDKLGEVLAELQARTRIAQQRQRDQQEARDRDRRDWEDAMASARRRFADAQRIAELSRQVKAWKRARRIRDYCDTLDGAISAQPGLAGSVGGWVAWCRAYADRIDPVGRIDLEPDDVEPRREDLRPYLGRFSPYGPEER
jgi:hypothetical protein